MASQAAHVERKGHWLDLRPMNGLGHWPGEPAPRTVPQSIGCVSFYEM